MGWQSAGAYYRYQRHADIQPFGLKGRWVELSLQAHCVCNERAGRPQYDTYGELASSSQITPSFSIISAYLTSSFRSSVEPSGQLNAEIVLGTIRNRDEAVQWLGYTYRCVRFSI
jgi:pre-mRNA-splicing helicase BRR2